MISYFYIFEIYTKFRSGGSVGAGLLSLLMAIFKFDHYRVFDNDFSFILS